MSLSSHSIQQSIRDCTIGNQNIPMIELVTKLINIYGVEEADKYLEYNYIKCIDSSKYISDTYLDELIGILLGEGKDMALAIDTIPEFSNRFTFYYDTFEGNGIIKLKEHG